MKIIRGGLAGVFVAVAMICGESVVAAASCDSLMSLSLARTTVSSA